MVNNTPFTAEQKERMQMYKKPFIDKLNSYNPVTVLNLQKAKTSGYICPLCNDGAGKDGTGIQLGKKGMQPHITCFKGCFDGNGKQGSDLFGCLKIITGKSENEILQEHFPNYDITQALKGTSTNKQAFEGNSRDKMTDEEFSESEKEFDELMQANEQKRAEQQGLSTAPEQEEPAADYTAFLMQAADDNLTNGGRYLKGRGISLEIQAKFGIGYCSKWKHPKRPLDTEREHTIFPTSASTYTARYAGAEEIEGIRKKQKVGRKAPAFAAKQAGKALSEGKGNIVFIVEGESDCLSIWECGGIAIATGSITTYQTAIDFAKEHKQASYIISFDNDQKQETAKQVKEMIDKLKAGLDEIGVLNTTFFLSGSYKDTNERLQADRAGLEIDIKQAFYLFLQQHDIFNSVTALQDFEDFVENRAAPISTGFKYLDKQLGGGIYSGQLIALGAESSMGKTTLLLQMADNMAAAGNAVLFFSLEQSRYELLAKSLCREYNNKIAVQLAGNEQLIQQHYKSNLDISDPDRLKYFDEFERLALQNSKESYLQTIASDMYINEGRTESGEICSISDIEKTIQAFIKHSFNSKPIVFIDYLQILSTDTERPTDETTKVNRTVSALRRICREYDITIFVISSLNRESYKGAALSPIQTSSFKQSGTIEYSADILLAWEYAVVGDPVAAAATDKDKEEQKQPRECRIKVLKNRNGRKGGVSLFNYYADRHYIAENTAANNANAEEIKSRMQERAAEQGKRIL